MTVLAADHVGFTVSDLDRAVAWYEQLLGAAPLHVERRYGHAYTGEMIGYPGAELSWAYFALPGGGHLELIEYARPAPLPGAPETRAIGNGHLCLLVEDIHAEYERLAPVASFRAPAPVRITAGANEGGWAVYLRDPDGITIELIQRRVAD